MRVLVTGASGFLGSRLVHVLCGRGDDVRVLVRPTSDLRRIAGLTVEKAVGDITDRASVEAALDGVELVYHAAAYYELGVADPARLEAVNVGGTANVIQSAAARGVRTVYVSSVSALGPTGPEPMREDYWAPEPGPSAYAVSKRRAHELAHRLVDEGAPVRIALPSTIYGPDDPSIIGRLHRLFARGYVVVGALPDFHSSFVYVDDCASGLVAMADRGKDGESYILSNHVASGREWIDTLAAVSGRRRPFAYVPFAVLRTLARASAPIAPVVGLSRGLVEEGMAMVDGIHWSFDGSKALGELDWRPRSFEEGLADTMAWYSLRARG